MDVGDLHGSVTGMRRPPGLDKVPMPLPADPETAAYRETAPRHCWVEAEHGWTPGLISEWRKSRGKLWEGRVWYGRLVEGRWVACDEWVLQSSLAGERPR